MALDDAPAERQPDAYAWKFLSRMETLTHFKHTLPELRCYPDPIVAKHQHLLGAPRFGADTDPRARRPPELNGVRHQVLKQVEKLAGIPDCHREMVRSDIRVRLVNGTAEIIESLRQAAV